MVLSILRPVKSISTFFRQLMLIISLALLLPAVSCLQMQTVPQANADDGSHRKTTAREILKVLKKTSAISVTGVSLETQILDFKEQTGVTVVRDRRVDPESVLTFSLPPTETSEQLNSICRSLKSMSWQPTDQFIYLAPETAAPRLAVLMDLVRQELKTGPKEKPGVVRPTENLSTESLPSSESSEPEEPRRIFLTGASAVGWTVVNPESIPHDLWNPVNIPRLPFIELAALILNQFDLSLQRASDNEIRIVPFDPNGRLQRSYQFDPEVRQSVTEQIARQYPELKVRWSGNRMTCTATLAQHCSLQQTLQDSRFGSHPSGLTDPRTKHSGPSLTTERFTLKADRATTIGQLIEHFRGNGIAIEITDEDTESVRKLLQRPIRVDLKDIPGIDFFPKLFGDHFQRIEVLDQRIILHP
ncbi:MAG: hypothetical protein ACK526_18975 [Planctomyces sp.]